MLARQVLELVLLQQVVAQALEQEALLVAVVVLLAEQEVLLLVVVSVPAANTVVVERFRTFQGSAGAADTILVLRLRCGLRRGLAFVWRWRCALGKNSEQQGAR